MKKFMAGLMGLLLAASVQAEMPRPVSDGSPGLPGQSDEWWAATRKAQAAQEARGGKPKAADGETNFYTGKPYDEEIGGYIFKYRNYSPEMQRWTATDPSGFPDGTNNYVYVSNMPIIFLDAEGFTGKSVLWVTIGNLASNGNFDPNGTFNYMADFNSQYSILKGTMEAHDTATDSTLSPTHFLDDGDVFHKYVASSNASLSSTIDGYSRVFFITHGQEQNGNYTFLSPDGTWQPTSFFGNLASGAKIVMVTCCDGAIPSGGNVVGGSGSAGDLTWNAAMQIAVTQTWDFLYE